jgi:urease beta subunit
VGVRHYGEARGALQTDRNVTEFGKHLEVAPGPATKIEYRERRLVIDVLQQRRDVLANVVIARAFPELFARWS